MTNNPETKKSMKGSTKTKIHSFATCVVFTFVLIFTLCEGENILQDVDANLKHDCPDTLLPENGALYFLCWGMNTPNQYVLGLPDEGHLSLEQRSHSVYDDIPEDLLDTEESGEDEYDHNISEEKQEEENDHVPDPLLSSLERDSVLIKKDLLPRLYKKDGRQGLPRLYKKDVRESMPRLYKKYSPDHDDQYGIPRLYKKYGRGGLPRLYKKSGRDQIPRLYKKASRDQIPRLYKKSRLNDQIPRLYRRAIIPRLYRKRSQATMRSGFQLPRMYKKSFTKKMLPRLYKKDNKELIPRLY